MVQWLRSHEKRGTSCRFQTRLFHNTPRFVGSARDPPWLLKQLGTGVDRGWRFFVKKTMDCFRQEFLFNIDYLILDYNRVCSGLYCDSLFITDGIISWDYWSSTMILIYQGSPWCFTNTNIITDLSILHSPDSPGPNKSFRIYDDQSIRLWVKVSTRRRNNGPQSQRSSQVKMGTIRFWRYVFGCFIGLI